MQAAMHFLTLEGASVMLGRDAREPSALNRYGGSNTCYTCQHSPFQYAVAVLPSDTFCRTVLQSHGCTHGTRHYCHAADYPERHLGPTWPSKWLFLQSKPHSPPPPEKTVASGIKSAVLQNDRMPLLGKQSVS